ncbi:hypothetical protein CDFC105_70314 [Clostridioides difficile]|nr:hypothetical protein CDFC105_62097 [Clostridioides difficile]CZS00519.1 hypothetical protein CDFC105_70314 [Clostridioides difficile]
MGIRTEDIKVRVNYPQQCYWEEEIETIKSKWILDQQLEMYGEENLLEVYPIWIRIKEIESDDITYEEAKKIAIEEYKNK